MSLKLTPTTDGQLICYNIEKEKNVMDILVEVDLPWNEGLQRWLGWHVSILLK